MNALAGASPRRAMLESGLRAGLTITVEARKSLWWPPSMIGSMPLI